MITNTFPDFSIETWQPLLWFSGLRPSHVPQVDVNRLTKLASPWRTVQPNFVIDTALSVRILHNLQIRHAAGFSNVSGHNSKKARPARGTLGLWNDGGNPQMAAALPRDFTRLDRRDIFRATVFLCSTPFDTPRISSG